MRNKRKSIFLSALIFLALISLSQPVKFNYQYAVPNSNAYTNELISYKDHYYLFGFSSNTITSMQNLLSLVVTDTMGQQTFQKDFANPTNFVFYSNSVHNFVQSTEKFALFTGLIQVAYNKFNGILAKFDLAKNDTVWIKTYTQPGDSTQLTAAIPLADSTFIVCGSRFYILNNDLYSKPFIMKIDKNGTYRWHKYLNNWAAGEYLFVKALKLTENDFILAGTNTLPACNTTGFVMRIDTMGNKSYEVGTSGIPYSYVNDLIALQDGTFMLGGSYAYFNNCLNNRYRAYCYRFNGSNGSKINSKTYNNGGYNFFKSSIVSLAQQENGKILAGGGSSYNANPPYSVSYFYNLNYQLDSLTAFMIDHLPTSDNLAPYKFLNTPDRGFVMPIAFSPYQGQQKHWIIKADSNGCYIQNCPVGFEEIQNDIKVSIWPNPVSNLLHIGPHGLKTNIRVSLSNSLGQVLSNQMFKGEEEIKLEFEKYPKGVYFLGIYESERLIGVKKLVKE